MPTFEDIQSEIQSMLDIADDLTSEQQAVMDEYLNELASAESQKIDNFASFIRSESARSEYYKEESRRLSNKSKTAEQRINYLKMRYAEIMRMNGLSKVSGNAYCLSLRLSQAVCVENLDLLPEQFKRIKTEITPDKIAIKESLLSGIELEGCKLIQNASLQIK